MTERPTKQRVKPKDTSFYGMYVNPVVESIADQFKARQRTFSGKKPYNNSQTGKYSSS
jgi:hypothetical protein